MSFCAKWPLLGMLSTLACSSLNAAEPQSSADQHVLGAMLFNQTCRVCHSENAMGVAPYGPFLWSGSAGGSPEAMSIIISEGTARMPAWKYRFSKPELAAIVAYLGTIRVQQKVSEISSADALKNRLPQADK